MANKEEAKWVFLSHSNKDYLRVRLVRNKLEEVGFYPIMLYLKCFENAPNENILEFLKKEIDARQRFVLCQSENSLNSYWVRKEVEYIKATGRPYEVIDLNDMDKIDDRVQSLTKRSFVLIVSSEMETDLTSELTRNGFIENGIDDNMPVYELFGGMTLDQYEDMANSKCRHALRQGYILLLFHFKSDYEKGRHFRRIMNIVNADQGLLDYLIPVRMDQEAEVPEVVRAFANFLDVSSYPENDKVSSVVKHLRYVDILKNPQL